LVWIAVTLLSLALFIAALFAINDQFNTLSFLTPAQRQAMSPGSVQQNQLAFFSVVDISLLVLSVILGLEYFTIAIMIVRARWDDWMAMFVSLFLITFIVAHTLDNVVGVRSWGLPVQIVTALSYFFFALFFYIFPNGRFVPGWTRWLTLLVLLVIVPSSLLWDSPYSFYNWPRPVYTAATLAVLASAAFAQVYRYRHLSSFLEKQQIKWLMYGAVIAAILQILSFFSMPGPLEERIAFPVSGLSLLLIPASVGIAVLRYHLWNIDLIINRTLVYVPLTAIIAGGYSAALALLQRVFVAITGQASDAAVILTTLVLAASFTPLKNGLQSLVDKRFKEVPDAARKLRALAEQVGSELALPDPVRAAHRLLDQATEALQAQSGAVYLTRDGQLHQVHAVGDWTNGSAEQPDLQVPLESNDKRLGMLRLGPRRNALDYRLNDVTALQQAAGVVAAAIDPAQQGPEGAPWRFETGPAAPYSRTALSIENVGPSKPGPRSLSGGNRQPVTRRRHIL
jgi:hypothetical protein